ncbi:MAG: hypothetical protein MUC63_08655, partial [Planctomycetes bacterium]|nr:hypothetical protein [Planctomycetota bacterium]
ALEDAEGVEAYRSDYRWISNVTPWTVENLYLVELRVSWTPTGFETDRFLEASRLFYIPPEDEESSEGSEGPAGSSGGGTG